MAETDKKSDVKVATAATAATVPGADVMKSLGFTAEQIQFINQVAMTAAVTAVQASQSMGMQQVQSTRSQNQVIIPQCHICQQLVTACKEKHVKMVVYPTRYPEFARWWPGYKLNGVRYISHSPNQKILVPEIAVSAISQAILAYEENERTVKIGRTAQRHGGSIGPHGNGGVPTVNETWR